MEDLARKNEIDIVSLQGDIKLLSQKIDVLKHNDLYHVQKSLDWVVKFLWGVGFLILGQILIGLRITVWG
jgi:hypothetical protein